MPRRTVLGALRTAFAAFFFSVVFMSLSQPLPSVRRGD